MYSIKSNRYADNVTEFMSLVPVGPLTVCLHIDDEEYDVKCDRIAFDKDEDGDIAVIEGHSLLGEIRFVASIADMVCISETIKS